MGYVVVISLPLLIIIGVLVGVCCYYAAKKKGRQEAHSQITGTPAPPLVAAPPHVSKPTNSYV